MIQSIPTCTTLGCINACVLGSHHCAECNRRLANGDKCCVYGCGKKAVRFNDGGHGDRCFGHWRPTDGDVGRIIMVDEDDEFAMNVWRWNQFFAGVKT